MVWQKSVNFRQRPIFCWRLVFDIFSMAGRYNKPVQCGRESAHKSRAEGGHASLDDSMHREQHHHQGEVGDFQRGLKSAAADSAEPNSKEILLRLCQHFADTKILSAPIFCWRLYFVGAYILLMPSFCRRLCRLHTAFLHWPLSSAATKKVQGPDTT